MSKLFSLFVLLLSAQVSFGQSLAGKSAVRQPGVSYQAYKARASIMGQRLNPFAVDQSAVDSAVKFRDAKLAAATPWENEGVMVERFKKFRDLRFMADPNRPDFARRSSWLYPDDGCFARAALAIRNLAQWSMPVPNKIFVFGDLDVKTANSPDGEVTWWYHVAPLVEIAGQKYVLDPAIEPNQPLKLEAWLAKMSSTPQELEVSVCGSGAYTPYDTCSKVSDGKETEAEGDQISYLGLEWSRLEVLKRNPQRELGDNPPWN